MVILSILVSRWLDHFENIPLPLLAALLLLTIQDREEIQRLRAALLHERITTSHLYIFNQNKLPLPSTISHCYSTFTRSQFTRLLHVVLLSLFWIGRLDVAGLLKSLHLLCALGLFLSVLGFGLGRLLERPVIGPEFVDLSDVIELLFVELETNRIVGFYRLPPHHEILESGDLEAEDKIGDVGLKVSEEAEVVACFVLSPLLIDSCLELLDDFELHHEVLLKLGVNEPLAGRLVAEVERSLLGFLLSELNLLSRLTPPLSIALLNLFFLLPQLHALHLFLN